MSERPADRPALVLERFIYDTAAPLGLEEVGREDRPGATVHDVRYRDGSGREIEAYLVRPAPAPAGPRAGILWHHWLDTEAPDGNRGQFVDEAVEFAGEGVVSLLPQGWFPWADQPKDSTEDARRVVQQVVGLRRGLDLLEGEGAPADRLAIVGHDFGGMLGGVLSGVDHRAKAYVIMAAVPRWSDWFLPFFEIAEDRFDYMRAMDAVDPIRYVPHAAPASLLFQMARNDYFVAAMTGREFQRAASEPNDLKAYDSAHDVHHASRDDRLAFLREQLGL